MLMGELKTCRPILLAPKLAAIGPESLALIKGRGEEADFLARLQLRPFPLVAQRMALNDVGRGYPHATPYP